MLKPVSCLMVCVDRAYVTTDSEMSLLQQFHEIVSANQQQSASASSVDDFSCFQ